MGVAAEHRYAAFAARQATAHLPSHNQAFVADLNSLPKNADAGTPFGDAVLSSGNGGWWMECPTTGYGYWYRTIRLAVRAWRVSVHIDGQRLICIPLPSN